MEKILVICSTRERARQKFNEYCIDTAVRVLKSELLIEFQTFSYKFTWVSDVYLECKMKGLTFDSVIVDETVTLSPEQQSLVWSRVGR